MWWLEHGVAPQVADEMPMERAFWLRHAVRAREDARENLRAQVKEAR